MVLGEKVLHKNLERQLRRCGLDSACLPEDQEQWEAFLSRVAHAYVDSEHERYLLERSLEVSSGEMESLYESLRERSASEIESERNRLRAVIDCVGAGLCMLDQAGRITAINPEATTILGWTNADAIGSSVTEWTEWSRVDFTDLVSQGQACRDEDAVFRARSGVAVPVSYVLSPVLQDGQPTGAVLVFSDMTDIRRAAEQLSKARDEALEGARVKSEFLANMSHEIRTPMNGVLGMANILLDTELDPEQEELVRTLESCSNSLLGACATVQKNLSGEIFG